MNDLEKAT
jgi:hypothetical protein